jgi:hypothetical protein
MQRQPRADEERDEPEEPERAPSLLSARDLQAATPARSPPTNNDDEHADDDHQTPAQAAPKQQRKKR